MDQRKETTHRFRRRAARPAHGAERIALAKRMLAGFKSAPYFREVGLVLALVFLVASCGERASAPQPLDPARAFSWGSAKPELATAAQRIAPGSSDVLDILGLLGLGARVAVVPEDAKTYADAAIREQLTHRPTFARFSAEALLAHAPDLVIASPWNASEAKAALRARGVPVIELPPMEQLAEVKAVLAELGSLLDVQDAAKAAMARLDAREQALLARAAARGSAPRILGYSNYGGVGRTPGALTSFDEVLRLVGARNASAEAGLRGHATLSFEELLAIAPELLVIPNSGRYEGTVREHLVQSQALQSLPALKQRGLIELEARLLAANSHGILDAAEALMAALEALPGGDRAR